MKHETSNVHAFATQCNFAGMKTELRSQCGIALEDMSTFSANGLDPGIILRCSTFAGAGRNLTKPSVKLLETCACFEKDSFHGCLSGCAAFDDPDRVADGTVQLKEGENNPGCKFDRHACWSRHSTIFRQTGQSAAGHRHTTRRLHWTHGSR